MKLVIIISCIHGVLFVPPLLLLLMIHYCNASADHDPTVGFTEISLNRSNFVVQRPYDVPLNQRYSFIDGTHRMWVYADDRAHDPKSRTQPRTEIRITGLDYSSGVWQFEGHGFVPNGTSGATVAQIFGASHRVATTLILRVYEPGELRYYSYLPALATAGGLYDRWFKLNIIHDVDGGTMTVFVDDEKKLHHHDKGPGEFFFKCGVYAAPANISYYMESRWRDIKIYRKL